MQKILSEEYGTGSHEDIQWEESWDYYAGICKDFELLNTVDIYEYFERLKDKRYAVNDKISELFSYLGLEGTVQEHFHSSYYAIISDQELIEEVDEGKLNISGVFRDGRSTYEISSSGNACNSMIELLIWTEKQEEVSEWKY